MAWYILQTKPLYEAKVIERINKKKEEGKFSEIREIFAPEELITEYKDGKKKERMKKLYGNYLYIEMDYTDEVWHQLKGNNVVKGIDGVVAILGNKNRPSMIPDSEVEKIKKVMSSDAPKPKIVFEENEIVRITSGAFAEFNGVVKGVDYEKNKIKVELKVFGRDTITEMSLNEVEHAKD